MNVQPLKKLVPKAALPYLRAIRAARNGASAPADPAADPTYAWFAHNYGEFHLDEDYEHLAINDLDKPSGGIRGCIVHFCAQLPQPRSVLLPGEPSALRDVYADMLGASADTIVTTGLMDDADFIWNFEEAPPAMGTFDLVLSQAMLEHLIDPYKHMRDLAELLNPGGHLVMLTVLPGFPYHRHPIDCVRFFPDWFEEVAQRLSLDVVDKLIWQQRIVYLFRRSPV